jgi:segregation and condensation protein A
MEPQNQGIPVPSGLLAPSEGAAPYAVKLPIFEGPLDLLLHLTRLNEVEITDIPIARVCEQYLAYLDLMRELNIDVASEYLVMAATLAWIKSQMLLPVEVEDDEDAGLDPRAELVRRLLDYQRFKEVAEQLGERQRLGRDVFPARTTGPERPSEEERAIAVDLTALLGALRDVLRSAPPSGAAHELFVEPITVRERMVAVMDQLAGEEAVEFVALLRDAGGDAQPTLGLIVATFLAILELARLGVLRLYQGRTEDGAPHGPIHVRGRGEGLEGNWTERISEYM